MCWVREKQEEWERERRGGEGASGTTQSLSHYASGLCLSHIVFRLFLWFRHCFHEIRLHTLQFTWFNYMHGQRQTERMTLSVKWHKSTTPVRLTRLVLTLFNVLFRLHGPWPSLLLDIDMQKKNQTKDHLQISVRRTQKTKKNIRKFDRWPSNSGAFAMLYDVVYYVKCFCVCACPSPLLSLSPTLHLPLPLSPRLFFPSFANFSAFFFRANKL